MGLRDNFRARLNADPNFLNTLIMVGAFGLMLSTNYLIEESGRIPVVMVIYGALIIWIIFQSFVATLQSSPYKHLATEFKTFDGVIIRENVFLNIQLDSSSIVESERSINRDTKNANSKSPAPKRSKKSGVEELSKKEIDDVKEILEQANDKKLFKYFSFKLRTRFAVLIPPFERLNEFIALSPKPFENTFNFRPRKNSAFYLGSICDHPSSDSCVMHVLPIALNVFGINIPICVITEASGLMTENIEKWKNEVIKADIVVNETVKELQEKLVKTEGDLIVKEAQLLGEVKRDINVKRIQANIVTKLGHSQDEIEESLGKGTKRIYVWKWFIIALVGLGVALAFFLWSKPEVLLYLEALILASMPLILLGLILLIVILYLYYRGKR